MSSLRRDALVHLRGACVWALLIMVPLGAGHVWLEPHSVRGAFDAMAMVLTPYALVTLAAILAWCVLSWRVRYLAMALVLGPMTLLRPAACIAAVIAVWLATKDPWTTAACLVLACCQLAVEPVVGRSMPPQNW